MAKFVYIYKGGRRPETEEEGKKVMEAWQSWLGGMGDHVVDAGAPFGESTGVKGGSTSGLGGYSVVTAGSLGEAAEHAKGCPIFASGGGVEVYEAMEM